MTVVGEANREGDLRARCNGVWRSRLGYRQIYPTAGKENPGGGTATRAALVPESYHDALLAFKKQLILSAIAESDGTLAHAARLLGLHPNYLHRLVTNLELRTALKKTG